MRSGGGGQRRSLSRRRFQSVENKRRSGSDDGREIDSRSRESRKLQDETKNQLKNQQRLVRLEQQRGDVGHAYQSCSRPILTPEQRRGGGCHRSPFDLSHTAVSIPHCRALPARRGVYRRGSKIMGHLSRASQSACQVRRASRARTQRQRRRTPRELA